MKLIFIAVLLFALSIMVHGQTSSLSGQVTDMNGVVMPGTEVLAITNGAKDKREFLSRADSYGVYSFKMPGGSYRLEFKVKGCKNFVIPEYVLGADTNARLDAEIPVANCEVTGGPSGGAFAPNVSGLPLDAKTLAAMRSVLVVVEPPGEKKEKKKKRCKQ